MYDTPFRSYDPQLGRFHQIDLMADSYANQTPYNYANNDPIYWSDPTGLDPTMTDIYNELMSDRYRYGGSWSPENGYHAFSSNEEAFWEGFDYIEAYDLWDDISEWSKDSQGGAFGAISRFYKDQKSSLESLFYSDGYFEGVKIFDSNSGNFKKGAAMTLPGIGIFLSNTYYQNQPEEKFDLLRHEFGHILQARRYGLTYFYGVVAPVSLTSTQMEDRNHRNRWTETEANTLSYIYFGMPNDWNKDRYPINTKLLPGFLKNRELYDKTFKKRN